MHVGTIVKVSKLCNLRCTYCYEMDELADPARMSLAQIEQMFLHLREYLEDWGKPDKNSLEFIWHGGEPFAQPISYWTSILDLQTRIFGEEFQKRSIQNTVQSNLTLITPEHLPLLRRFHLGFSYDVVNDLRVTAGGKPTAELVEKKIEWLKSERISIGGIAVISRINIDRMEEIASYFLSRRIPFRALNIYEGKAQLIGARDAALPFDRYLECFKNLWRLPIVRKAIEEGLWVDPLSTPVGFLSRAQNGQRLSMSAGESAHREWMLAVNTNGDVYSPGDCYNPEFRYGNIFRQPLDEIMFLSDGRSRRIERTQDRFRDTCEKCPFYLTSCEGTYVSHATPEDAAEYREAGGCYYRALGEWIQTQQSEDPRESLYLNLTYRCNSDCLFCAADIRYKENPRNLTLDNVAAHLGGKHYRRVELSGGEPTIHPKIVEIVKMCREHSATAALLTHGRQLQNLAFARKLLEAGANLLIIPLYGATAEEHDYITNAPGSFAQTVKGFENLQALETEYPFWVELKLLLTKATAGRNRDIYHFARDRFPNGFHEVSICPLIHSQSTLDYKDAYSSHFENLRFDLHDLATEIIEEGHYSLRIGEFPPCFFSDKLLDVAHPQRDRPTVASNPSYADEHSSTALSMKDNPRSFRGGVAGNALVTSCRQCRYDSYCANLRSPYFSTAYLQQFGESEFRPEPIASLAV